MKKHWKPHYVLSLLEGVLIGFVFVVGFSIREYVSRIDAYGSNWSLLVYCIVLLLVLFLYSSMNKKISEFYRLKPKSQESVAHQFIVNVVYVVIIVFDLLFKWI